MRDSSMFRNGTFTTPVNTRSTFFPSFLERLFAPPSKAESEREARITAIQNDLDARLASRKARRLISSPAAHKGWQSRRRNHV